MKTERIDAHCEKCEEPFVGYAKYRLNGFQKLKCPACNLINTYPLRPSYYGIYLFFAFFGFCGVLGHLSSGGMAIPGVIPAISIMALIKDLTIRRRIAVFKKRPLKTVIIGAADPCGVLIRDLKNHGVVLKYEDGKIKATNKNAISPDLWGRIKEHHGGLISFLQKTDEGGEKTIEGRR